MSAGQGSQSSVGVGTEGTPGTGVVPTIFLPILSESFSASRPSVPSESIVGDSMLQSAALDIEAAQGGVELELDGASYGQMVYYWSGYQGYTYGAWAHGAVSAFTATAVTGGSVPNGVYRAKVASIYQSSYDGRNYIMPAAAEQSVTTSGGSNQIDYAWSSPTPPTGYTLVGTALYLSAAGGAANSQKFVHYLAGAGVAYSLTSLAGVDTNVVPFVAVIHKHEFIGTPPVSGDRLKTFSATINKNVDVSERYVYCMANEIKFSAGGASDKMGVSCSVLAQKAEETSNPTASFNPLEPFMGWAGIVFVDGQADCTIESFEFTMSNNCEQLKSLCAAPYPRAVISGKRGPGAGTIVRQHEDKTFWRRMRLGTEFALKFWAFGQPLTSAGCTLVNAVHGVDAVPFRYRMELDFFRCLASEDSSPITGPGPIKETINFTPMKSLAAGTEMKITIFNNTAQYV